MHRASQQETLKRTAQSALSFSPSVVAFDDVHAMSKPPERVFYIQLPTMDDTDELAKWQRAYSTDDIRTYKRAGYRLTIRELVRRLDESSSRVQSRTYTSRVNFVGGAGNAAASLLPLTRLSTASMTSR